jgi:hypothetical protein
VQLLFIALAYAAVFVVSAALLYHRHLMEVNHAAEVSAASGMYAGGDLILDIFIAGLFLIPTIFLVRVMARFEVLYLAYSQLLLGISLSAPVCLSLLAFGEKHVAQSLSNLCLDRLFWSPLILVGLGVSRLVARFDRAKKLTSYALLVEGLTVGIAVAMLFFRR